MYQILSSPLEKMRLEKNYLIEGRAFLRARINSITSGQTRNTKIERQCKIFLMNVVDELLIGDISELMTIKGAFESFVSTYPLKQQVMLDSKLAQAFKWSSFQGLKRSNYRNYYFGAYSLAYRLGATICPYCNRNYTFTVGDQSGVTRPELDHFLSRSSNLYLSYSLYNLVPSCSSCNRLKSNKAIDDHNCYYPYRDDVSSKLIFSFKSETTDWLYDFTDASFEIDLLNIHSKNSVRDKVTCHSSLEDIKGYNFNECFKLTSIYQYHKSYVSSFMYKANIYNNIINNDNIDIFNLFSTKASLIQFIFGLNVFDVENDPLSKLTRDLFRIFLNEEL
jgi:hypothetical protein